MSRYVEVAINLAIQQGLYHYHLPPELAEQALPGCLVIVPFGAQQVQGVIWRVIPAPQVAETRAVSELVDPQPALTPAQMALAEWMARETLSPLAEWIDLMLPPGMSQHVDTLYRLNEAALPPGELKGAQRRLVDLLRSRGPLRGRQIDAAFRRVDWRASAEKLRQRGWVTAHAMLPPATARAKQSRRLRLAVPPGEIEARLAAIPRQSPPLLERRRRLLDFLTGQSEAVEPAWAIAASNGATPADVERLVKAGLIVAEEQEIWRDPLEGLSFVSRQPPALTPAQAEVWSTLQTAVQRCAAGQAALPHLLYGITGSGKTELYLRAVAETLAQGRQALVLVPEIALTPQTVHRFAARFPGRVGLVHSRLSAGERYDTWRRARSGELDVVVGPRSALFTPLAHLGLIVVDEFHDESYYQDDFGPAYHAVEAALALARLAGGLALLGSATPDVVLMQRALQQGWPVLRLPERILAHRQAVEAQFRRLGRPIPALPSAGEQASLPLPPVQVVDMRQELQAGNRTIFSRALQRAMDETLAAGQQAILFLNRRGKATYVFCRACGASLNCPRCDLPLTYHGEGDALVCHTCNYRRKMPSRCPACGSPNLRQLGLGTERVEDEVRARFPMARTLRWDAETSRQKDAHELILKHFADQHADVLIGTQMIAKGLDLPMVTLVGVILADVGIQLPDYRAAERGFQLLTQVAGRAGRSPLGGQVVLQTYLPQHYAIRAAAHHDFDGFLRQELDKRRTVGYPPFARLVRLELREADAARAANEAERMGNQVTEWLASGQSGQRPAAEIIGPTPCFFSRRDGLYRWQIILRGPDPAAVLRNRDLRPWRVQVDPPSLL